MPHQLKCLLQFVPNVFNLVKPQNIQCIIKSTAKGEKLKAEIRLLLAWLKYLIIKSRSGASMIIIVITDTSQVYLCLLQPCESSSLLQGQQLLTLLFAATLSSIRTKHCSLCLTLCLRVSFQVFLCLRGNLAHADLSSTPLLIQDHSTLDSWDTEQPFTVVWDPYRVYTDVTLPFSPWIGVQEEARSHMQSVSMHRRHETLWRIQLFGSAPLPPKTCSGRVRCILVTETHRRNCRWSLKAQ